MKIGYQLKQVRERIAKGLVDKGVLRTEKKNFVLFDMPTHPLNDSVVKQQLVKRVSDSLMGRGPSPDARTICMICAAQAGNVLENVTNTMSFSNREAASTTVDMFFKEYVLLGDKAKAVGITEIIVGVMNVYTKVRFYQSASRGPIFAFAGIKLIYTTMILFHDGLYSYFRWIPLSKLHSKDIYVQTLPLFS